MKKALKIIGISLASLVFLLIIGVFIFMWIVVTPERLTPIVRNQTDKFIQCQTQFDAIDVTFFSTFPHIGLEIKNFTLINPMSNAPSDTLAYVGKLTASINISELLKNNSLQFKTIKLKDATSYLYVNQEGKSNYDVFVTDTSDKDTTFELPFDLINVQKININNLNVSYTNESAHIFASIKNLNTQVKGEISPENACINAKLQTGKIDFQLQDSLPIHLVLNELNTKIEGNKEKDEVNGLIRIKIPDITLTYKDFHLTSIPLDLQLPFDLNIDQRKISMDKAQIEIDKFKIIIDGIASQLSDNIDVNLTFESNTWNLTKLISLIPDSYKSIFEDIDIKGNIKLKGDVQGTYNDSLMPLINAHLSYDKGEFAYANLPLSFTNISGDLSAILNLNQEELSSINIHSLKAQTNKSNLSVSGNIKDFFNTMLLNLRIKGKLFLPDIAPLLPSEIKINSKEYTNVNIASSFTLNDLQNLALEKWKVNAIVDANKLNVVYNDSIFINTNDIKFKLNLPSVNKDKNFTKLFDSEVYNNYLRIEFIDGLQATLNNSHIKVNISDFRDTSKLIGIRCDFDIAQADVKLDSIQAKVQAAIGSLTMMPSRKNKHNPDIQFTYNHKNIDAKIGTSLSFSSNLIQLKGKGVYDGTEKELLLQWNPNLHANLKNGLISFVDLSVPVNIPSIEFDFTPEKMQIDNSKIILGKSMFSLSGTIRQIEQYIRKTDLLTAELDFVSDNTDVSQIMDIVSGMGASDTVSAEHKEVENEGDNPFMVPLGMNVRINTWIKNASVGKTIIENVKGGLTVKDGIMVLDQIGFTCDAAEMQLTAIYKSPRKNHLFAGIDFHLLDIDIKRLIDMIPELDTLLPMLQSFAGKAEFHVAAETYLKSNYELKMSTLRSSAALEGKDLVLLDNQTFSDISKLLGFNKKTENKVDTLAVEFTVYKNEIDIYPFLIVMDKYKAVVGGRHNLDMSFDYHISLTDSPLPARLGLDVKGKIGKLKYALVPCKYGNLYRPEKQKVVEKRTLELKKIISDALKANVQ